MSRTPLTLITVTLVPKKTTLTECATARGLRLGRIALFVNEFGDVGLDHDLIVRDGRG